jgi:hypothetical protein
MIAVGYVSLAVVNRYPPQSVGALAEMGGCYAHLLCCEIEETCF